MNCVEAVLLVALTHINFAIILGFVYTNGIYQIIFLEVFSRGSTVTSWVSSGQLGMLSFAGPLGSLLIGYMGCGMTAFIGALITSSAIGMSAFLTNVEQLIAILGFLSGIGFSLIFTASLCLVPEKFTSYRIVASGISTSGAGIGTILWSWLSRYLIDYYGWRGALLISSGVNLQICVFGMIISLYDSKSVFTYKSKQSAELSDENQICTVNVKPQVPAPDRLEKSLYLPPKHTCRSLMNLRTKGSLQYLYEKRPASCFIETTSSLDDITRRKQIADSFLGKSLSSVQELYQSAILYNKAEVDKEKTRLEQIITTTKEVFTDFDFVLLSINVLLYCFGLSIVYTHVAPYAVSVGLSASETNTLLSTLGFSNLLGRMLLGVIGNECKCLNIVFLYSGCYALSGLATLCMIWWHHPFGLIASAAVVGFFSGAFGSVLTELTCVLLGAHRFYLAYGYMLVFMGIGFVSGAPIAGLAHDYCQQYSASLYIGGAVFGVSSIIILPSYFSLKRKESSN